MAGEKDGGFKVLQGYPPDVVAVSAHGRITAADYENVLIPLIERTKKSQGKVKLLYVLGSDLQGFSAGAALDDAKVGLLHLGDFARIAVVTDVEWIRLGLRMFAPLLRAPVRVFPNAEAKAAGSWISETGTRAERPSGVALGGKSPVIQDDL